MDNKNTKKAIKKKGERDISWHDRFLELLSMTCNVTLACKGAGVSRSAAYAHRNIYNDFAGQWDDAEESAIEMLEAEAWKRAKSSSDTLLIFLLKARKPERYREQFDQRHQGHVEITIKREDKSIKN